MDKKSSSKANSFDVAKLAGVSRATVSRAFSNDKIDPETRERVMKAARQLNYKPNALARGLTMRRSNLVALLTNNIRNPREAEIYDLLLRVLKNQNRVALILSNNAGEDLEDVASALAGYQADAVVVFADEVNADMARRVFGVRHPIMCNGLGEYGQFSIFPNGSDSMRELVSLLIEGGSKAFGYIGGRPGSQYEMLRFDMAKRALETHGMSFMARASGGFVYEGGADAACQLMRANPEIDTLICANDAMAVGAIDALRNRLNLSVPDDVSVTGYDNIEMAGWPAFDLTTIEISASEEAKIIGKLVDAVISGKEAPSEQVTIPGRVIIRKSTRETVRDN